MNKYDDPAHINIGSGQEYSIKELAEIVARVVGWTGEIEWGMTSLANLRMNDSALVTVDAHHA